MEVPPGFEPGHKGFADLGLTAWLWHRIPQIVLAYYAKVEALLSSALLIIYARMLQLTHARIINNHQMGDLPNLFKLETSSRYLRYTRCSNDHLKGR